MRSLLGSLSLPKESAAITPAWRKKKQKMVVSIWEIQDCKSQKVKFISVAKIRSKNKVTVYCFTWSHITWFN